MGGRAPSRPDGTPPSVDRTQPMHPSALWTVSLLAGTAVAQATIPVTGGGAALQNAINAAAAGDTLAFHFFATTGRA